MKITPKQAAIHVDKPEGSSVDYYIFNEFEIHYNDIAPGTVQAWHHHPRLHETIYVIEGEIEAHWLDDNNQKQMSVVKKGDVIEVENTPHTFINQSNNITRLIVFRFIPQGLDLREVIKNDKVRDPHLD